MSNNIGDNLRYLRECFDRQRQRGASLLEVLVAMAILAIGLLGMAALMGNAMRYHQGALARTQAVLLVSDIVERVRINRPSRTEYNAIENEGIACNPAWAPSANNTVAENDLSEWFNNIACNLPGGIGGAEVVGDNLFVWVGWVDTSSATVIDHERFSLSVDL